MAETYLTVEVSAPVYAAMKETLAERDQWQSWHRAAADGLWLTNILLREAPPDPGTGDERPLTPSDE